MQSSFEKKIQNKIVRVEVLILHYNIINNEQIAYTFK